MLTADLVRVAVRRGEVRPRYIDPHDPQVLELARCLIDRFNEHGGKSRGQLQACLDDLLGTGTEYLLHRGLTKLLFDRCDFETDSPVEPAELRRAIFQAAADAYGQPETKTVERSAVFPALEERFSLGAEALERSFYADLKEEQTLTAFQSTSPSRLLKRYNVALAQAVLLRAESLEVRISGQSPARYRELFRSIKFFQLLYAVKGSAESGYLIHLDGPLSLFRSSQRYGLQMATFLPTLIKLDHWKLEAVVRWGKSRARHRFRLSSEAGLESERDLKGQWQPEELGWLEQQFSKLGSDWSVSRETDLVDLRGQGVLVPDHVFIHEPTGKRVYMELFGFWRRGALAKRLDLLREHGPESLIVGISKDLRAGEETLDELPGKVYIFRNQPIAREVLGLLREFVRVD